MPVKTQRSSIPTLLIIAGALLVLGAIAGYFSLTQTQSPETNSGQNAIVDVDQVTRVGLEEAKSAFDTQSAVFVDVRSSEVFAQDRIPGAISIPLDEIEARLGELDRNAWIITYCT